MVIWIFASDFARVLCKFTNDLIVVKTVYLDQTRECCSILAWTLICEVCAHQRNHDDFQCLVVTIGLYELIDDFAVITRKVSGSGCTCFHKGKVKK